MQQKTLDRKCPTCGSTLVPVFFSAVCEYCATAPDYDSYYQGWTVCKREPRQAFHSYAFPDRRSAELWRDQELLPSAIVKPVLSVTPFCWRVWTLKNGSAVRVSERMIWFHLDHRFKPDPIRVFLAPPGFQPAQ
jgi:hypothetical protein